MKLSTRTRYGTRLILSLGRNYGLGPVLLKDIAREEEISEKYLSQIVIVLKAKGLISSVRGAHGGYVLTRPPEKLNLLEIVEALEGDLALVDCVKKPSDCGRTFQCITREVWSEVSQAIRTTLSTHTVRDLLKKAKTAQDTMQSYQI